MEEKFIQCGEVVGVHGLRGEVRVMPWTDTPDYLRGFSTLYLNNGETPLVIVSARLHKSFVLFTFAGYEDRDAAMTLRSKVLYLNRRDDPEQDTPFLQDFIGLTVTDIDSGQEYGKITEVLTPGANDVFVIKDTEGIDRLVPDIPSVVIAYNLQEKTMQIRPLKGLFDDAD